MLSESLTCIANRSDRFEQLNVFLCYSFEDNVSARKLYNQLSADDIMLWFEEEELLPGQDWELEITKAIRASDAAILCLSRDSVTKAGYIHKKIKHVFDVADEQPEGAIFIIPLKLGECDVPERLRHLYWVNYFEESGYRKLKRALQHRAKELRK